MNKWKIKWKQRNEQTKENKKYGEIKVEKNYLERQRTFLHLIFLIERIIEMVCT